jgi:hypothetical protein
MPIHAQMSASTALACAAMVIGSCIAMPAQNSRTAPRVVAQAAKHAIRVKTRRPAVAGKLSCFGSMAHVSRILWPDYTVSRFASTINRRWLQKQAFVLSLASSALTLVAFPLYHTLTVHYGEATAFEDQPQRLAVLITASLCVYVTA